MPVGSRYVSVIWLLTLLYPSNLLRAKPSYSIFALDDVKICLATSDAVAVLSAVCSRSETTALTTDTNAVAILVPSIVV